MSSPSLQLSEKNPSFLGNIGNLTKKILKNVIFQILSLIVAIGTIGVTYAAWTTLTTGQGATGQPVNQTLMQGIINNLNDLATRLTILEDGETTGGTVTGDLRWSASTTISGPPGTYYFNDAYDVCRNMSPIGKWRVPTADEMSYTIMQYGVMDGWTHRYNHTALFPMGGPYPNYNVFITSSPYPHSQPGHLAWYPNNAAWLSCQDMGSCFINLYTPIIAITATEFNYIVRCVSDA